MGAIHNNLSLLRAEADAFGTTQCRAFRRDILERHQPIENQLLRAYIRTAKAEGYQAANRQLNEWHSRLLITKNRFSATMPDDEIRHIAELLAAHCERLYSDLAARADFQTAAEAIQAEVVRNGLEWPVVVRRNDSESAIRSKVAGAIARTKNGQWWRRRLRVVCGRAVERVLREAGAVCRHSSPYVSNWAYHRWIGSQRRNAGLLANMDAINEEGEVVPLDKCVEASVSNPENRRNELMTRIAGWEKVAEAMKLRGLFLTLTCPSAYHARLSLSGDMNPNYNGATPRVAQDYLCGVWARIRAAWGRVGIKAFGFRVCEPHHDGTPHFHFMLFFSPDQAERAWTIFREHALAEDGDEKGAQKYRADSVFIDPAKGTASGYIAKYVSKNIDGYGFKGDEIDDEGGVYAEEGAGRVRAWASIHGIRQFQQIGACSVTVWRELRRRTEPLEDWEPEQAEALRKAADDGDWATFVELMGGAFVRRDEQTLRALHVVADKPGIYGDEVRRILGLVMRGAAREIRTRFHEWRVVMRDEPPAAAKGGHSPPVPLDLCQ